MRNNLFLLCLLVAVTAATVVAAPVVAGPYTTGVAQAFSVTLTFDENGNGVLTNTNGFFGALPASMMADSGPGGLANVLFYGMLNPPGLTAGDVQVLEPGGSVSDVLRFDPTVGGGGVFVYSDNTEIDALADVGLPTALSPNFVNADEAGPECCNGIVYSPSPGQPGFVAGAGGPVTYVFISDTPEPSSIVLIVTGGAALLLRKRFARIRA